MHLANLLTCYLFHQYLPTCHSLFFLKNLNLRIDNQLLNLSPKHEIIYLVVAVVVVVIVVPISNVSVSNLVFFWS